MHAKKLISAAIVALALTAAGANVGFAQEREENEHNEQKIALRDCPAAVQQTINQQAAGAKVVSVEKYTDDSGTVAYEAKFKNADNQKMEVKVAANGKLLSSKPEEKEDEEHERGEHRKPHREVKEQE